MASKKQLQRKLFISHAHQDADLANAIASTAADVLSAPTESLFFVSSDENRSIQRGDHILRSVTEALKKDCIAVIILLTEHSYNRPWIHFEAGAGCVLHRMVPIFLPGCPTDVFTAYSQYNGIDLRDHDPLGLRSLFKALAQVIGRGDTEENARKFAERLSEKLDLFESIQQIATVCTRQGPAGERQFLLVRSLDRSNGEVRPGNQRLFPKCEPRVAGKRVFSDSVCAMFAALTEAGVAVSVRRELGIFEHWKEEKNAALKIKAILADFVEDNPSNRVQVVAARDARWFELDQAIDELGTNRQPKYAGEYRRILYKAFESLNG